MTEKEIRQEIASARDRLNAAILEAQRMGYRIKVPVDKHADHWEGGVKYTVVRVHVIVKSPQT